jgi:hypothetical protein
MIAATWRSDIDLYKNVNAQMVADEISTIGDEVTPARIVDLARDEKTELHKCFEWDDRKAAEAYRIEQAKTVLRVLVVKQEKEEQLFRSPVRLYYKTDSSKGYTKITTIVNNEDLYQDLLRRAYAELRAFKIKYACLTELHDIFELIN